MVLAVAVAAVVLFFFFMIVVKRGLMEYIQASRNRRMLVLTMASTRLSLFTTPFFSPRANNKIGGEKQGGRERGKAPLLQLIHCESLSFLD